MSRRTSPPPDVRRATGRAPSDLHRSGVPSAAYSSSPPPPAFPRRPLRQLMDEPGVVVVRRTRTRGGDIDTLLLTPAGADGPRLAVKVPATRSAEAQVEREARMLVEVRRLELGRLRATVPRFVQLCEQDDRMVLVASAVPGRSLTGAFCRPGALVHKTCRPAELTVAGAWLARFQDVTLRGSGAVDLLPPGLIDRLELQGREGRASGEARRDAQTVADRARRVQQRLACHDAPRSAVHGDFRAAHVLVDVRGADVTGVLDWRAAQTRGEPLVDLGRFAVTHDPAHPGGHRAVPGATVLAGRGFHAESTRRFLKDGLARLGLPESLWYPVAWAATASLLAEIDGGTEPRRASMITRLLARSPDPATH